MKHFARRVSVLAAVLSLATGARAADTPAGNSYDWTGFYLGINAGVAWNTSTVRNSFDLDGDGLNDLADRINGGQTAFTGGGILGLNYQIDHIVLGAEADINYMGFGEDNRRSVELASGNIDSLTARSSFEADWFGTLRGRLGYAIDNVLVYGTGGLAYGHWNAGGKVTGSDGVDTFMWKGSTNSANWGWTLGAGAEYGIDHWSLGLEYLYVDLGHGQWNGNNDVFDGSKLKGSADFAFSTVRATAKYRFP